MKPLILVHVWCEIDPSLNLRIDRESGLPIAEEGDALLRVSPLGRFGVDSALRFPEASVTAFAVGDGHEAALRHALASGASRAIRLDSPGDVAGPGPAAQTSPVPPGTCDALPSPDRLAGLARWVEAQSPAVVIGDRASGILAGRLGWAHLARVDDLRLEDEVLHAIRDLGRGDRERVHAVLPAVIRMAEERLRVRYVSRDRVDGALQRAIDRVGLGGSVSRVPEPASVQLARPRTRVGQVPQEAPSSGLDRMKALMGASPARRESVPRAPGLAGETPEEMAEAFVRYLRHHELME